MPFKVGKYEEVDQQMRTLFDLAILAGIRESYVEALAEMNRRLQDDPLGWAIQCIESLIRRDWSVKELSAPSS